MDPWAHAFIAGAMNADDLLARIGAELRELRLVNGHTQLDMAVRTRVGQGIVSYIERGHRATKVGHLVMLATATGARMSTVVRKAEDELIPLERLAELAERLGWDQ